MISLFYTRFYLSELRSFTAFLLSFCPIYCYSGEINKNDFPEWWGNLSTIRFDSSECPNLKGIYSTTGDLYELMDDNPSSDSQTGYAKSYASSHINFNKKPFNKSTITSVNSLSLEINQDINSLSIIKPSWENPNVQEKYLFSTNKDDYKCKDGWLIFSITNETVGHESSHTNFKESIRYSKLEDGSLVGCITQAIKSSSIYTLGFGETHERKLFVKFSNIKN